MRIRKIGLIFIAITGISAAIVAAGSEKGPEVGKGEGFTWNKYDEGLALAAKRNKPLMVDFYTDWCGFCKKMDKITYSDSLVAKYIKDHFVAVKINAESREAINLPTGQTNGINVARSFGVTGYPSIWFLSSDGKKINNLPGFRPPDQFIYILRFIGDGHYKSQTWQQYYSKVNGTN